MSRLEKFGTGGICDRHLYVLELADLDSLPSGLSLEGAHFACAILLDADSLSAEVIGRLAVSLLEQGLVYACTWGPDCERVHDIFDEEIVGGGPEIPRFPSEIMTSWHPDESLDDALWFLLSSSYPDDKFFDSCTSSLILSIGNVEWSAMAREAASDPASFSKRVLAAEPHAV